MTEFDILISFLGKAIIILVIILALLDIDWSLG